MLLADIVSASGTSWDEVMADFQLHSMNFAHSGEGGQARCPAEERDMKIERARDAAASKRSTAVAAGGRVEQEEGSRSERHRSGTPESYPERVKKLEALVSVLSVFQPLSHQLQNCRADSVPLSSLSFLLSSAVPYAISFCVSPSQPSSLVALRALVSYACFFTRDECR